MGSSKHPYSVTVLLSAVLAGIAGFAANWFKVTLFLNVDFLFGSILTLVFLGVAGIVPGMIASLIASSATYILWNHPYAIVIFAAETFFVGWFLARRSTNIVLLDTLFWIVLGMPLVVLFYGGIMGTPAAAEQLMLKQAVNGIFNAFLASLILMTLPFIRLRGGEPADRKVGYHHAIFTIMVGLVLVPALAFLLVEIRSDQRARMEDVKRRLSSLSSSARSVLDSWLRSQQTVVKTLADSVKDPAAADRKLTQQTADTLRKAAPTFLRLGVMNRDALSLVYSPAVDSEGRPTAGRDFSDRPFYHEVKKTRKSVVSDVVMGRIGAPQPIITICEPLIVRGEFAGYAAGVVNFDALAGFLKGLSAGTSADIHLLDRDQTVVVSTSSAWKSMAKFLRDAPGERAELGDGIHQWIAQPARHTPMSERWRRSFFVKEALLSDDVRWTVVVEESMAPTVVSLNRLATRFFLILMVLIIAAVALSHAFSRKLVRSLSELERISGRLPASLDEPDAVSWPQSMIAEVSSLVNNYRAMADRLRENFREIREAKESMALQVQQRTAELTREIQERRRKERELQGAGEIMEQIFATSTTHIAYLNRNFDFIRVNKRYADANGKSPDFFVGKNHFELFPHEENEMIFRRVVEAGVPYNATAKPFVYPGQPQLGVTYWDWSLMPVKNIHGAVDAMILSLVDVTDRVKAEEALKKRERDCKSLLENNPDLIVRYDRQGRHLYVNRAVERALGKHRDEIVGTSVDELGIDRETADTVRAMVSTVFATGKERVFELASKTDSGPVVYLVRGVPEFSLTGDVQTVLFIFRNLSGRTEPAEGRSGGNAAG